MKALERPAIDFFQKEANKKPKSIDKYQQWLKSEDQALIEYIKGEAESCAERKAAGYPFKKPSLKTGYERRLFEETMQSIEASIEMSMDRPETIEVNGLTFDSNASEAEIRETIDIYGE